MISLIHQRTFNNGPPLVVIDMVPNDIRPVSGAHVPTAYSGLESAQSLGSMHNKKHISSGVFIYCSQFQDNKVGATTKNTRQLGCAFLYPYVIPDPYTTTVALRHDDEFIIIGNRGLYVYMSHLQCNIFENKLKF